MCDRLYDLQGSTNFSSIGYMGWAISQIIDDILRASVSMNPTKVVVMSNPEWLKNDEGIMGVIHELQQLCEAIHKKWPEICIHLLTILDLVFSSPLSVLSYVVF